jgi:hypothetical protein
MGRACMGKKNAYRVSVRKPEGKDHVEDPTLTEE